MKGTSDPWHMLTELAAAIEKAGMDSGPILEFQKTAFTTSSEYKGELKIALKKLDYSKIKSDAMLRQLYDAVWTSL
jgi:hypothetical protein